MCRPTWPKKMVFLTGPRQVGKTTLSRQLIAQQGGQYLNDDVPADRTIIRHQGWNPLAPLRVLDEIHNMPDRKTWLKGVVDGKATAQQQLVTGSARTDTFRQSGESLAGRFFGLRLHPLSVREGCQQTGAAPDAALTHLLERGGFREPCLAPDNEQVERWRRQYFDGQHWARLGGVARHAKKIPSHSGGALHRLCVVPFSRQHGPRRTASAAKTGPRSTLPSATKASSRSGWNANAQTPNPSQKRAQPGPCVGPDRVCSAVCAGAAAGHRHLGHAAGLVAAKLSLPSLKNRQRDHCPAGQTLGPQRVAAARPGGQPRLDGCPVQRSRR